MRRDENCPLLHLLLAIPAFASASVLHVCVYVPFTCSLLRVGHGGRCSFPTAPTEPGEVSPSAATKIILSFQVQVLAGKQLLLLHEFFVASYFLPSLPTRGWERGGGGDLFLNKQEYAYPRRMVTLKRYERNVRSPAEHTFAMNNFATSLIFG